jgi:hypothetical protein
MKRQKVIHSLLPSLLLVSSVVAQTSDPQSASSVPDDDGITAARIPYLQTQAIHNDNDATDQAANDSTDGNTLAQMRRRPGRPFPPRARYPRASYPSPWVEPANGRHAAIGAVIGFGLGAALGAKANTDQHPGAGVQASLLIGTLGAAIGAAVGYATPSFHTWSTNRHQRRWPQPNTDPLDLDQPDTNQLASSPTHTPEPSPPPQHTSTAQPVDAEGPTVVSRAAP